MACFITTKAKKSGLVWGKSEEFRIVWRVGENSWFHLGGKIFI